VNQQVELHSAQELAQLTVLEQRAEKVFPLLIVLVVVAELELWAVLEVALALLVVSVLVLPVLVLSDSTLLTAPKFVLALPLAVLTKVELALLQVVKVFVQPLDCLESESLERMGLVRLE
jgi:hypothetical protein